jgi:hypothetical protein
VTGDGSEDHATAMDVKRELGGTIEGLDEGPKSSDFIQHLFGDFAAVGLQLASSAFENLEAHTNSTDVGHVEAWQDETFVAFHDGAELHGLREHGGGGRQGHSVAEIRNQASRSYLSSKLAFRESSWPGHDLGAVGCAWYKLVAVYLQIAKSGFYFLLQLKLVAFRFFNIHFWKHAKSGF